LLAAGLVFAEYGAKLAIIDQQQFALGGVVPSNGGEFGGNSHSNGGTPFFFRGRSFEAEAKEIAIVNKKSSQMNEQMSVSGTPKQILSAINSYGGGVNFAPGASLSKLSYGGMLGMSVTPPSFTSSYYAQRSQDSQAFDTMMSQMISGYNAMISLNSRIDNLQVILNPNQVKQANDLTDKYVAIGTL
jgi:hypothetical protein